MLGIVKRPVGAPIEQAFGVVRAGFGNTETHGDFTITPAILRHQFALAFGDPDRLFRGSARENKRKLLTAHAHQRINFPQPLMQALSNILEYPIARVVTKAVVDSFKEINVRENERKGCARAVEQSQLRFYLPVVNPAIGQAGERVLCCHLPQFCVDLGKLFLALLQFAGERLHLFQGLGLFFRRLLRRFARLLQLFLDQVASLHG